MKCRKGLSTVVGVMFAIIALLSIVSYITYSMNTLDKFNQSILVTNQENMDRGNEEFRVEKVTLNNNKFNITVQNAGNLPISINRLWVENKTHTDDWIYKYDINEAVAPGGETSNIGQNIPLTSLDSQSYKIMLVTERGNSQQFTVNSASSAPLKIQLLAFPPTISSGFTTGLVMLVTNNGSGTLFNLAPQTPSKSSGFATCELGPVSPSSYDTLPPGSTAIFKWDLTVSGKAPDSCTYTAELQNPYPGNTAQATVTLKTLKITATDFATHAGVLSINYTSFRWSQGGGDWHHNWNVPKGANTVFSLDLNNNNVTGTIWLSNATTLVFYSVSSSAQDPFYIVKNVDVVPTPPTILQPYTCLPLNDYCIGVPGTGTATLYFAAKVSGGNAVGQFSNVQIQYTGFLIVFGKYSDTQNDAGSQYGQNIPYIGLLVN